MFANHTKWSVSILLFATLILSACHKDDPSSSSEQVVDPDLSEYSQASCRFKYSEGPGISEALAGEEEVTTSFKKKLNMKLLRPVLGSSASELVRFAEQTNVRFYKTAAYRSEYNSCEFASALPEASTTVSTVFNKASSKDSPILGLYLPSRTPEIPDTDTSAVITVRRDANKWIFVHEYLHHLFYIQAAKKGFNSADLQFELKKQDDIFEKSKKSLTDETLSSTDRKAKVKTLAQALIKRDQALIDLLKSFTLEEMTIENLMGEKMETHEISQVHEKQRLNGAAYILSSQKKASGIFDEMSDEISLIRNKYLWELELADTNSLSDLKKQISDLVSEMSDLKTKALSYLEREGYEYKGMRNILGESSEESGYGCGHGEIPEEIEKIFIRNHSR